MQTIELTAGGGCKRARERERDLNKVTSKYKHCFLDIYLHYNKLYFILLCT